MNTNKKKSACSPWLPTKGLTMHCTNTLITEIEITGVIHHSRSSRNHFLVIYITLLVSHLIGPYILPRPDENEYALFTHSPPWVSERILSWYYSYYNYTIHTYNRRLYSKLLLTTRIPGQANAVRVRGHTKRVHILS